MARSLRSLRQVATLMHGHMARRFAPAFRALGVCEHYYWDIWATLLSPKWAETFVAQMAGDEMSLPRLKRVSDFVGIIFFYQTSWIFVINQVPCVSSCWGEDTHPWSATSLIVVINLLNSFRSFD